MCMEFGQNQTKIVIRIQTNVPSSQQDEHLKNKTNTKNVSSVNNFNFSHNS